MYKFGKHKNISGQKQSNAWSTLNRMLESMIAFGRE